MPPESCQTREPPSFAPEVPAGFYIDDQSNEEAELFIACHEDGWCGPERDALVDAIDDAHSEATTRQASVEPTEERRP